MDAPRQTDCRNRLLQLMTASDFDLLAPSLKPVPFPKGQVLIEKDTVIREVHFPESGIMSIVAISPEGHEVEAGLFGRDGTGPIPAIMGSDRSPTRMQSQVEGRGYALPSSVIADAMDRSPSLRSLLLKFAQVMSVQTAYTALSNAVHPIEERLARWILMVHDRSESDDLAMTHEFMSVMLAVRRPSVTTSLHVLEGNGFIRNQRGWVMIRNRAGLEDFAGDAYGKPEAEYRRLIGPMMRSSMDGADNVRGQDPAHIGKRPSAETH